MTPCIFGLSGLSLGAEERAFFRDCQPAGYILFARNIADRGQLRALTDSLRDLHGRDDLAILIDQEGGRVARLRPPEWPAYPAGAAFDRLYDVAPVSAIEAARANARLLALDLAEVGVTVDCLPLLDVRQPGAHDVIGDRALGREPMRVAALGRAVLEGLADGGVVGVIKHMPGHGRTECDTHLALPRVTASEADLETDLAPFRALASHARIGMTGHLVFDVWDAGRPATLSPKVIDEVIRGAIGFDGLLLTDDIDMQALSGSIAERSAQAIAAGCDLVLNCWARMPDMAETVAALPAITPDARARLDRALAGRAAAADMPGRDELVVQRDALLALAAARA